MDLILWRHAQAHALPPEFADVAQVDTAEARTADAHDLATLKANLALDLARALTPKGERQAERMAHWLHQRLPESTRVLVSPARRTQQTAQALGRSVKTVQALDPQAAVEDLLQAARWPQSRDPVLIVGHQPTLGMLAARLLTGQDLAWSIRKGAVWWLRGRDRDGNIEVTLHAVQSPDFL